ncbi:hypothetical protein GIB67_039679 [Kingdonia uniflora]|uniref:Uncharacterized protein n=1 Tax=Kingdonia uniflora TaxID=39325 RepID=A0A7J7MQC7_9MAGN|nr:hypothetical protein GIB67_039679 [Kingdonia uniflora]
MSTIICMLDIPMWSTWTQSCIVALGTKHVGAFVMSTDRETSRVMNGVQQGVMDLYHPIKGQSPCKDIAALLVHILYEAKAAQPTLSLTINPGG